MGNSEYDLFALAEKAINYANKLNVDYADIRLENFSSSGISYENKKVEGILAGTDFGLGIRIIYKGKIGFYSTTKPDPIKAVNEALKLAKLNPQKERIKLKEAPVVRKRFREKGWDLAEQSVSNSLSLVKRAYKTAQIDKRLKSIKVAHANSSREYLFASTEGSEIYKQTGRTKLYVYLTAKEKGKLEQGVFRLGAKDDSIYKDFEKELVSKAKLTIDLINAKKPPAGKFKVLLNYESAGVFAHEALGHAVEADLVLSNQSILKGLIGKKIASEAVNISDDSTILSDNWSSYKYDDEGVRGTKTEIIKNGVLKSYLHSRETAEKMNVELTGNGRAQDYAHIPIVRMSNTSFESGTYSFKELLEQIKDGYYLVGFKGGQVNPLEGTFTFASEYCYRIKNRKITELLKGCTFSGKILDTLKNIEAIEKGKRKFSIGFCGKAGQRVPVSDGGTHVLVSALYLGGENEA